MKLLTDNTAFAQACTPHEPLWRACDVSALSPAERRLATELFSTESLMVADLPGASRWDCLFAVDCASRSQYDSLAELAASGDELPARVLCCAAEGERFHGFKGRGWHACRGNIHLAAYVRPDRAVDGGAAGFIVAAVVAALQAAEGVDLQGERCGIKWVNDLLVGGAKVGGVLARLQTQRDVVKGAVVGIGLNVARKPHVERDPCVPAVAALVEFARERGRCSHAQVFPQLADCLGANIERLYGGGYGTLLDIYRERSVVLGRRVTVRQDRKDAAGGIVAAGRVDSIGSGLQLHLEGQARPVTKGRLVLEEGEPGA